MNPPNLSDHATSSQGTIYQHHYAYFKDVYMSTMSCLRGLPALRHVSRDKLVMFCMDLCVVACGIRLGYLFDAFAVRDRRKTPGEVLAECLTELQKDTPCFRSVSLVHEQTSDQMFFVNGRRLQELCHTRTQNTNSSISEVGANLISRTAFISVQGSSAHICPVPSKLPQLLADLARALGERFTQRIIQVALNADASDISTLVAFAACVLEFPVAYVPASQGSYAFLAGVPLDVYECVLRVDASVGGGLPETHTMARFTCPHCVAETHTGLRPEGILRLLRDRFEGRLREAGFPGSMTVRHFVETRDRVAL
ncbi:hypothetical protein C2E23DRAFT_853288 [Lenzites betulinus]|nr:hypothetical protein C2E23DRAFT_853288 [Lenzites betulinus]